MSIDVPGSVDQFGNMLCDAGGTWRREPQFFYADGSARDMTAEILTFTLALPTGDLAIGWTAGQLVNSRVLYIPNSVIVQIPLSNNGRNGTLFRNTNTTASDPYTFWAGQFIVTGFR